MKTKKNIIWYTIGLTALSVILFRNEIEDGLACLAYYDQCTAKRISNLTKEECLNRDDAVAFLLDTGTCLVKQDKK